MASPVTPQRFRQLALGVLVYNLAVVGWGALVRATGSGAGCGAHWPECNGEVIPTSPALTTIIEFTHRITSGLALVTAIGLLVLALLTFPPKHPARLGAALFALSMVLEVIFGALLVVLHLVEKNASPERALFMSMHQVVTFYLFASIALTVLWSGGELGRIRIRGQGLASVLGALSMLALPLLAVSGAVAALGDTLYPAGSLAEGLRADLSPATAVLLRLRVLHPVLAVVACGLVMLTAATLARRSPRVRDAAYAVAIMFLLQLGAGVMNLALLAPVWMQLVHLLFADLTWLAVVRMVALALAEPEPAAASQVALAL